MALIPTASYQVLTSDAAKVDDVAGFGYDLTYGLGACFISTAGYGYFATMSGITTIGGPTQRIIIDGTGGDRGAAPQIQIADHSNTLSWSIFLGTSQSVQTLGAGSSTQSSQFSITRSQIAGRDPNDAPIFGPGPGYPIIGYTKPPGITSTILGDVAINGGNTTDGYSWVVIAHYTQGGSSSSFILVRSADGTGGLSAQKYSLVSLPLFNWVNDITWHDPRTGQDVQWGRVVSTPPTARPLTLTEEQNAFWWGLKPSAYRTPQTTDNFGDIGGDDVYGGPFDAWTEQTYLGTFHFPASRNLINAFGATRIIKTVGSTGDGKVVMGQDAAGVFWSWARRNNSNNPLKYLGTLPITHNGVLGFVGTVGTTPTLLSWDSTTKQIIAVQDSDPSSNPSNATIVDGVYVNQDPFLGSVNVRPLQAANSRRKVDYW